MTRPVISLHVIGMVVTVLILPGVGEEDGHTLSMQMVRLTLLLPFRGQLHV